MLAQIQTYLNEVNIQCSDIVWHNLFRCFFQSSADFRFYEKMCLRTDAALLNFDTLVALQKWVAMAYGKTSRSTPIQAIPQVRWYMFSKFQCEISNLLPTNSVLKNKIFCCHFVTLVLSRSLSALQNLLSRLNYGWESSGEDYLPTELIVCSCKTKCAMNRCKFSKNDLQNMDMWICVECENNDTHDAFDDRLGYIMNDGENRCLA